MPIRRAAIVFVVALLIVVQALAMATQFGRGYRPFGKAPTRVPFSWDMFAVDIDRCGVQFDPPVVYGGRTVSSLTEPLAPFEWDFIAGRAADYVRIAKLVCKEGTARATCFSRQGRTDQTVDCV